MTILNENDHIIDFNTIEFDFKKLFEKKFGDYKNWNKLHKKFHKSELIKMGHEVTNSSEFKVIYKKFVKNLPLDYSKKIYYQNAPTFRIGLPNERTTSFHTDDMSSGHGRNISNFWVPLNNLNKFNCLWIVDSSKTKSIVHKFKNENLSILNLDQISTKYAKPIILNYGKFLKFSNSNIHGTVFNKSNDTRISFDFRTLNGDINAGVKSLEEAFTPLEKYKENKTIDVISVVYSNFKMKHISHSAQRKIINDFCQSRKFKVFFEGAEWYNVDHYPLLNDLLRRFPLNPIIIFSKKCFDPVNNNTKPLLNMFKNHKGKIYFALENKTFTNGIN